MLRLTWLPFALLVLCSISLHSCSGAGLYGSNSNVIQLNKNNFAKLVLDSPHVWLVEFYAPWCGHCKNLAPAWEAAATNLKGIVKVGAINCDEDKELAGMFGIKGFPTIKVFPSEQSVNPYQKGSPWKQPSDYQGARSAAAIANYAISQLPNFVKQVSSQDDLQSSPLPKLLLFTDKPKTSTLYKSIAVEFKDRLLVGEVRKNKGLEEAYEVESYPTVIAVSAAGAVEKFQDSINRQNLFGFASKFALPTSEKRGNQGQKQQQQKQEEEKVVEEEVVAELPELTSQEVFEEKCLSHRLCVIAVLNKADEENTSKYRDTLFAAVEKNLKNFRFSWIDGEKQQSFAKAMDLASDIYPQLVVYSPKKNAAAYYLGSFETEKISTWLAQVLRGSKRVYAVSSVPSITDVAASSSSSKDEL